MWGEIGPKQRYICRDEFHILDTSTYENDSDVFGKPTQRPFQKCILSLLSDKWFLSYGNTYFHMSRQVESWLFHDFFNFPDFLLISIISRTVATLNKMAKAMSMFFYDFQQIGNFYKTLAQYVIIFLHYSENSECLDPSPTSLNAQFLTQ